MSLAEVYQQALEKKYGYPKGWMANWPPGFDQRLGVVGRIDDGKINRDAMLADKGIEATEDADHGRAAGPWTFQSDQEISVQFGVDASAPGWAWIGNAKAGLKIGFGKSEGVVLGVGSSHQERLLDIDSLKPKLVKAAEQGKIEVGQAVIVEKHVADSGLQATSQGHNAEFAATTNVDIAGGGLQSLASFAANLNVHQNSRDVTTETYPDGFTVAFRVLKLGTRGYWWWKKIAIVDRERVDRGELDEESVLEDDDYFALLTSAEFH
jgi:hypothetical protein